MKISALVVCTLISSALTVGCSDKGKRHLDASSEDQDPSLAADGGETSDDDAAPDEDAASEDEDAGSETDDSDAADESDAGDDSDAGSGDAGANDLDASDRDAGTSGDGDAGGASDAAADAAPDGAVPTPGDAAAPTDAGGGLDGSSDTNDGGLDSGLDAGPVGCANDAGLALPPGFCANVFARDLPSPRHISVSPAGDLYVALADTDGPGANFVALRDGDHDGLADTRVTVGDLGGNGIFWTAGRLYFAANDRVLRYDLPSGTLAPTGAPVELVVGLPNTPDHYAKSVVVDAEHVYVNIGSASNACQVENRVPFSPGIDPCPELATRAGIWKFDAEATGQVLLDGERIATGTRNFNALALDPGNNQLFGAQNGRDQLADNWPTLFTPADDQRLPAEGVYQVNIGDDYGWPYCYYDAERGAYLLAPEYGGDGVIDGRCGALVRYPATTLPAHWAPLGMTFHTGVNVPARYRDGLFIATHGSRFAPEATGALPGYNVVFIPFAAGAPSGPFERFAEGFAGAERPLPELALHRPVGVAQGPDGALYVSDDKGGYIYRIVYVGTP